MPTDADKLIYEVGRRVAELRVESNLTQAELADRVDVSLKYLQRLESGQENLTLRSLANLANIFGVEVAALFCSPTNVVPRRGRPPGPGGGV